MWAVNARGAVAASALLSALAANGAMTADAGDPTECVSAWEKAVQQGDRLLESQSPLAKVEAAYLRALELVAREDAGPVAESLVLDRLGSIQRGLTEYEKAELSLLRALQIRFTEPSLEAQAAETLDELAAVYFQAGQYSRSLRTYEQARKYRERVFGPGSPEVAKSLVLLGAERHQRGALDEAESLFRRAVELLRPHADDPAWRALLSGSLRNLAEVLEDRGRQTEADALAREASGLEGRSL